MLVQKCRLFLSLTDKFPAVLPWNCDDVLRQGNTVPGTYIIDTDGSGPLPESYAYCDNGRTIISHNMPNNTLIHSKELGNIRMVINYKLVKNACLFLPQTQPRHFIEVLEW